jgi:HD-GYP domain-containing protein (c-di-GMP phosphodiesterase class II)
MKESTSVSQGMMAFTALLIHLRRYQFILATLLQVLRIVEIRCPHETRTHAARVGAYAAEIYDAWAQQHGVSRTTIEAQREPLQLAAIFHDVGKIAIPQRILCKADRLTGEEYELMKRHTLFGARFFLNISSEFGRIAAQVALNHHERWDGSGYPGHIDPHTGRVLPGCEAEHGKPRGKHADEIPLWGRIVAIADVYDALSSQRTYKRAWKECDVLRELECGAGSHFDPEIVELFFASFENIRAIAQQRFPENLGKSPG